MSYRSHADLGGVPDERPIVAEPAEPLFHAAWEPKVLAMVVAMGATGLWNIDKRRSVRETLPNYTELTYYEIWLAALEHLLLECGVTPHARTARTLRVDVERAAFVVRRRAGPICPRNALRNHVAAAGRNCGGDQVSRSLVTYPGVGCHRLSHPGRVEAGGQVGQLMNHGLRRDVKQRVA